MHALRSISLCLAIMSSPALAQPVISYPPSPGGGTPRASQLWQDPGPNGNDLDSDAVCWQGFVLQAPTHISRIDWWGNGASELGFRIQVWKQDPGTIAYQPLAVFFYAGTDDGVQPDFTLDTNAYTATVEGTLTHYTLNLPTPISLPANDAANPRWFFSVIGLTRQAFVNWNWSQSPATPGTFYWIRGAHMFFSIGNARALALYQPAPPTCIADFDRSGSVGVQDLFDFLAAWFALDPAADLHSDGVSVQDLFDFLTLWFAGCP